MAVSPPPGSNVRNVLGPGELAIISDARNFQIVLFCQFGTIEEQVTPFWIPLSRDLDSHGLALRWLECHFPLVSPIPCE